MIVVEMDSVIRVEVGFKRQRIVRISAENVSRIWAGFCTILGLLRDETIRANEHNASVTDDIPRFKVRTVDAIRKYWGQLFVFC